MSQKTEDLFYVNYNCRYLQTKISWPDLVLNTGRGASRLCFSFWKALLLSWRRTLGLTPRKLETVSVQNRYFWFFINHKDKRNALYIYHFGKKSLCRMKG